ncbi:MAG: adenylyl-sulfate kinase [Zetaproteobacteria bacterium]|nr:MAG: adenylyl-sulfate kinase [Zetaproteobacteria bacterium]
MNKISSNVVWHQPEVTRADREARNGHRGMMLWLTGLSGSGKSTLAHATERRLHEMGLHTYVLDGDNVRHGLCGDLGFSAVARRENIRRISEVGRLFVDAGLVVFSAFISPFRSDRRQARRLLGDDFIEIYCDSPLEVCESRDIKGLYRRARAGEIRDFTGISSPYEPPERPELVIDTATMSVEESVERIVTYLCRERTLIPGKG